MDQSIADYRTAFAADPDNDTAFDALEEHYFVAGEWPELQALYQARIAAPGLAQDTGMRAKVMFRLGQVIEERRLDPDAALEVYWEVVSVDGNFRPALRQLRAIHARREQWDMVLQIAELEGNTSMKPYDRATFLVELGTVWQRQLVDTEQAITCFDEALELVPAQQGALKGRALCLEALGRADEAALSWETLIGLLRGPERAPAEVRFAKLLGEVLHDGERAAEMYRRALTDDPGNMEALEALVDYAAAQQQWTLLADLYERRFDLTGGARNRTVVALEASRIHLQQLDSPAAARMWIDRALELSPDDVEVYYGVVELERRDGDEEALGRALDRLIDLAGGAAPIGTLLEASELHGRQGREEKAVSLLNDALDRAPNDPRVLEALSSSLESLGRSAELADILERRAALVEDPEDRTDLLVELGRVYSDDLGDADARRDALTRAFDARPEAPGVAKTLASILAKAEDWESLKNLLERAAESGPADERCQFHCDLGELQVEGLNDPDAATLSFEAALRITPTTTRALQGLERIARSSGDEDALLAAWQREAGLSQDDQRVADLLAQIVPKLEARGQREAALEGLERLISLRPAQRELLESAARLQEGLGLEEALANTLAELDASLSTAEQVVNRLKLADLHARAGRDLESAQAHEKVLEADPRNLEALNSLRVHYLGVRDWEPLASVCRRLADLETGSSQLRRLDELAGLLEAQIGDPNGAIEALHRLAHLTQAQTGQSAQDVMQRLGALLEREERFEELADLLGERTAALEVGNTLRVDLELERALLLLDPLARLDEAAIAFRGILEVRPDELQAEDGLERAIRGSGDTESLVRLLAERCASESEPSLRTAMMFEQAGLLDEKLGQSREAAALYESIANDDGDDAKANEAESLLQELLERCGEWASLRVRLERTLAKAEEDDVDLRERLAKICLERVDDREAGCAHLEALAALQPARADVWRSLSELYLEQPDRRDDLLRATLAELQVEMQRERRLVLLGRTARLYRDISDNDQATRYYDELLELEAGNTEASEYLIDRSRSAGDSARVLELLEGRLAASDDGAVDEETSRERRLGLLLRIAEHLWHEVDDCDRAIQVLETALQENGPTAAISERLFSLYEKTDDLGSQIDLSRSRIELLDDGNERARWSRRAGIALRRRCTSDDLHEAIAAFLVVLDEKEGDREATENLAELYRELDEHEALAKLLTAEVESGRARQPIRTRLELATLLWKKLDRADEALTHLRDVLALHPEDERAFERALDIANHLQQPSVQLELIDARLERPVLSDEKAALLEMRGDLLAGPLERLDEAAEMYREVSMLCQDREAVLASWRSTLSRLERWPELLDAIELSARAAAPSARAELFSLAVSVASDHLGADAALPWLERLREVQPSDPDVWARIADLHRIAGRSHALVRALEGELRLSPSSEREIVLQRERAQLLAGACSAPGLAAEAFERLLGLCPGDATILASLDGLYELIDRPEDRLRMVDARLAVTANDAAESMVLHQSAATLCADRLGRNEEAATHWLHAVDLCSSVDPEQLAAMLRSLENCLRACHRVDAWARAAEAELALIPSDADDAEVLSRAATLHLELADAYRIALFRSDAGMHHLRALADGPFEDEVRSAAEEVLLADLRACNDLLALEARLSSRLSGQTAKPEEWLELARLRDEKLQALPAAAEAYRSLLAGSPQAQTRLAGIRGLRGVAERLADWNEVATMLEAELDADPTVAPNTKAALLRRLGEVRWHRQDQSAAAVDAYSQALEAQPNDLLALRSLQQLREEREEWNEALDLFDCEVEMLSAEDGERLLEVALHQAELAHQRTDDNARALRAFEFAAEIAEGLPKVGKLSLPQRREWADLLLGASQTERFSEVFADWCDDENSPAACVDHLRLAEVFESLGRDEDALARSIRASGLDPEHGAALDMAAKLQERAGDLGAAAQSLEQAAECVGGTQAADRLCHAAGLISSSAESAQLLRRAVGFDNAHVQSQALLADAEWAQDRHEDAERAAGCAIDLCRESPKAELPGDAFVATAMIGGRAAVKLGRADRAASFYAAALAHQADHIDALDEQADVLFGLDDVEGARRVLDKRLSLGGDDSQRPRQLVMLATTNDRLGEPETALARFKEAIELDPALADAHRGVVKLHEDAGHDDLAVAALALWCQSDPGSSTDQYTHAADLELRNENLESAERLLRSAVDADATNDRAWLLLADLLWDWGRSLDALDAAVAGLAACQDRESRSKLEFLRGRALEQQGDAPGAAEAFGRCAQNDGRRIDAALAQARLLRSAGEWLPAATAIGAFAGNHPDADDPELAPLYFEWGRLLAGPLENTEEAIGRFERALELDSGQTQAREQLANLLTHVPTRQGDAARQLGEMLAERPTHAGSLRSLMRIAREGESDLAIRFGLALLRALGTASPEQRNEASACLPLEIATNPQMSQAAAEQTRQLVLQCAPELSAQMPPYADPMTEDRFDPSDSAASYRHAIRSAEEGLFGVGLAKYSASELGEAIKTLVSVCLGEEDPGNSNGLFAKLDNALGRWNKRKLRRSIETIGADAIRDLDFETWRSELHALATAIAVDRSGGELRTALIALCREAAGGKMEEPSETADLTTAIAASPQAMGLLRHVVTTWSAEVVRNGG